MLIIKEDVNSYQVLLLACLERLSELEDAAAGFAFSVLVVYTWMLGSVNALYGCAYKKGFDTLGLLCHELKKTTSCLRTED